MKRLSIPCYVTPSDYDGPDIIETVTVNIEYITAILPVIYRENNDENYVVEGSEIWLFGRGILRTTLPLKEINKRISDLESWDIYK